ncbi:Hypothetical protein NTJ_16078 [Nesidiocoris tenuis]|uniref:Uncharacterized protein n=1 Tax=Nesidiocoris tenuis TaxID=355587 RepID=A0ABN7BHG3_9HEMI|nr:Hypothetical protein NTJ_16078 [Nesidiocoris tenuis]
MCRTGNSLETSPLQTSPLSFFGNDPISAFTAHACGCRRRSREPAKCQMLIETPAPSFAGSHNSHKSSHRLQKFSKTFKTDVVCG